jgi:hypothetical protein
MIPSAALHSPTASQVPSAPPPMLAGSFLSRCVKDLDPNKISNFDRMSKVFLVATIVFCVVLAMLGAGALVVSLGIPLSSIAFAALGTSLVLVPFACHLKKKIINKELDRYRAIQRHYLDLSIKTAQQLQIEFSQRGIECSRIPRPHTPRTLVPILAQARYFDDEIQGAMQTKSQLEAKVIQLINANGDVGKISHLRIQAQLAEARALDARIEAAFINAVLRNGDFNGKLEDIAVPVKVGDTFLRFKNAHLPPITTQDIKIMTVAQLGHRLHQAMTV